MKKQKKKLPFNVLRKSALAGLCCLTVGFGGLALAGCETAESDKAEAKWYSGTTNIEQVTQGVDGDYYFDTDDYLLYQKEEGSWKLIDSNFGKIETGTGSFLTGATAPATSLGKNGDTYFDYNYKDYYEKVDGVWTKTACVAKGTSATDAITIASAEEFVSLGTRTEYTYYQLTANIDLRDVNSSFVKSGDNSSYALAENFVGEINGNGYTITINDEYSYLTLFENVEGYFHNFTLNFPNIIEKEINFASSVVGETAFKDITTTGSIVVPSSGGNWSPYINFVYDDISFENCTNELDVVLPSYGSLFVGGYAIGTTKILQPDAKSEGYQKFGVLKEHVKISYKNCKNTAHVEMKYAAMLYGNPTKLPQLEDITIENCTNEGTIIGYEGSGLFCGYTYMLTGYQSIVEQEGYDFTTYSHPYFAYGDYAIGGDKENESLISKVGANNLKNTTNGQLLELETKDLYTVENGQYKITNMTEGNKYRVERSYYRKMETGGTVLVTAYTEYIAEVGETEKLTSLYNYEFLTDEGYQSLTNKEEVECVDTTVNIIIASGYTGKLYVVTDKATDTKYYYVKIDNVTDFYTDSAKQLTRNLAYEYNTNGEIISMTKTTY